LTIPDALHSPREGAAAFPDVTSRALDGKRTGYRKS
jgi:hypothetical protein